VREPLRIVTKDFIFGTVTQGRQGIYPVKDVVDFLGQSLCVTAPTEALETLVQSVGDGGGQGLTRFLGNLAGKFLGFQAFDTKWHGSQPRAAIKQTGI